MARRKVGDIFTYSVSEEFDYIDVWYMSDMHLGHDDFDEKEFKKYIAWVLEKPNRFIVGLGDYIECVTSGRNPGTSLTTQSININGQIETLIKLLEPVKDRIICMTEGNHEQRITKDTQFDITRHTITPRLNTFYLGYQGWLRIKLGSKQSYYIYLHHGPSRSASSNPKYHLDIVALKLGYAGEADLIAMGHNHKLYAVKYTQPLITGNRLYTHDCWGIRTGGFLNYPLYSRESLYRPADVGSPIVRYYRDTHDMEIFHDLSMYRNLNK
jgi:predicted phosphodiesterase